jgi:glycosyltransferase involved in cell wall biosynthesis
VRDKPLRVAYLQRYLPRTSETFVLDEAMMLGRLGVDLQIWTLDWSDKDLMHARHEPLHARARIVPRSSSVRTIFAALGIEEMPGYSRVFGNWSRHARLRDLRRVAWLARTWCREGVDVIRVHHAAETARYGVSAGLLAGIPVSVAVHARDLFVPTTDMSWLVHAASHITTITPFHRDRLLRQGLAPELVALLPCSVALPEEAAESPEPDGPLRLIAVGRLIPKKGHDLTLWVGAFLASRGVDVEVTVVGDGPGRGELEALAEQLEGASDGRLTIHLVGAIPNERVHELLRTGRFHAAILSCRIDEDGDRDGVPVALLEAQASGIPVVTSALPGFEFELGEGAGAVLVPLREEGRRREPLHGELLAVVSALYNLPEYRDSLASQARARALERESPEDLAVRLLAMLQSLCSNMRSA